MQNCCRFVLWVWIVTGDTVRRLKVCSRYATGAVHCMDIYHSAKCPSLYCSLFLFQPGWLRPPVRYLEHHSPYVSLLWDIVRPWWSVGDTYTDIPICWTPLIQACKQTSSVSCFHVCYETSKDLIITNVVVSVVDISHLILQRIHMKLES